MKSAKRPPAASKASSTAPRPRKKNPAPTRARGTGDTYAALTARFAEIADINGASAVMSWDQATYMPRGGAVVRGRQLATLGRLAHERLVDPELGRLIDKLEASAAKLDETQAAVVAVARRDFERAIRVPPTLVGEIAEHCNRAYGAWVAARPANDFSAVRSVLDDGVRLSRKYSACFPRTAHVLDPLIEGSDPGLTVAAVDTLFGKLKSHLVPMVAAARANGPPADACCLVQTYPRAKQEALMHKLSERIGYDLTRGRIDQSPHPFSITFGHGDVRITTRYRDNDFSEALFSTLHEAGHALYEQGVDPAYDRTPLAGGVSAGVHESQSRLIENMVGRGEAFLGYIFPLLQKDAAGLKRVPFATFQRAVNRVAPSLVRTDADELTYTLHVLIRFDLERRLLEGSLAAKDLPHAWAAAYEDALGVVPGGVADGCLQDVHWFSGLVGGAFQGYAIGNVLAAQLYEAALAQHPEIPKDIASGRFATLHGWLGRNIHRHGRRYLPEELIERATGRPLTVEPYVRYLETKYRALGVI